MSERELRKQFTIMVYSFIFKKILPTMDGIYKIGNIEYSNKLNTIISLRLNEGYDTTFFESFDFIIPKSEPNFVKDSNFNNWINGTSNPKSYEIINALIEYVYETCQADERLMQLRIELLSTISNTDFSKFSDHRIDSIINDWITQLKSNSDISQVFCVFKDLLYLLKDKNKHIAYLLHSYPNRAQTLSLGTDISTIDDNPESKIDTDSTMSDITTTDTLRTGHVTTRKKNKIPIYLIGIGSFAIMLILLFFIDQVVSSQPNDSSANTYETITTAKRNEDAFVATESIPSDVALVQENQISNLTADEISSIPSNNEMTVPSITEPLSGKIYEYAELNVNWESESIEATYDLALKKTATEEIVLEVKDLQSTDYTIEPEFLLHGTEYKLYIIAKKDSSSSEAAIVSFSIKALESPTILSPIHLNEVKKSDINVEWSETSESDTYKIVVTDLERWVKVYEKEYINKTNCLLDQSIFVPGISYRIYVCSQNSSSESIPNYIDIKIAPLEAPVIISPMNNTISDSAPLTLTWEKVNFAGTYKVDILETNTWETVYSKDGIYDTSLTLDSSLFQIGGSYRIYLFSMIGTASSPPTYLDLKAPELLPPVLLQPQNNAILPLESFTISWNPNALAESYSMVLTDTVTWEHVLAQTDITDTSFVIDKSYLTIGNTYRIYIKSNYGNIVSAPNYIDIKIDGLPIPKVLVPKRNTTYEDQEIIIEWEPNAYITTYKITVTDLSSWLTVYSNPEYTSERIIIDRGLLIKGNSYRVYIQSVMGSYESEPSIIDFTLTP